MVVIFSPLESKYKEAFDGHAPQDVIFTSPRLLAVKTCLKQAIDGMARKPQNHKENVKFSETDENSKLTNTGNILTGDYNCLLLVIID